MSGNEAAERLRDGLYTDSQSYLDDIRDALATERRATVERIRAFVKADSGDVWTEIGPDKEMVPLIRQDDLFAILDEEAER